VGTADSTSTGSVIAGVAPRCERISLRLSLIPVSKDMTSLHESILSIPPFLAKKSPPASHSKGDCATGWLLGAAALESDAMVTTDC
jgi:hypothetical protein